MSTGNQEFYFITTPKSCKKDRKELITYGMTDEDILRTKEYFSKNKGFNEKIHHLISDDDSSLKIFVSGSIITWITAILLVLQANQPLETLYLIIPPYLTNTNENDASSIHVGMNKNIMIFLLFLTYISNDSLNYSLPENIEFCICGKKQYASDDFRAMEQLFEDRRGAEGWDVTDRKLRISHNESDKLNILNKFFKNFNNKYEIVSYKLKKELTTYHQYTLHGLLEDDSLRDKSAYIINGGDMDQINDNILTEANLHDSNLGEFIKWFTNTQSEEFENADYGWICENRNKGNIIISDKDLIIPYLTNKSKQIEENDTTQAQLYSKINELRDTNNLSTLNSTIEEYETEIYTHGIKNSEIYDQCVKQIQAFECNLIKIINRGRNNPEVGLESVSGEEEVAQSDDISEKITEIFIGYGYNYERFTKDYFCNISELINTKQLSWMSLIGMNKPSAKNYANANLKIDSDKLSNEHSTIQNIKSTLNAPNPKPEPTNANQGLTGGGTYRKGEHKKTHKKKSKKRN